MTPKGKVTSWPNLVKISHRKVDKITSDFADKRNPAACNSSKSAIFPALRRSHPKFPERCRRLNLRVSAAYFDPDSLGFAGVISKIVFFPDLQSHYNTCMQTESVQWNQGVSHTSSGVNTPNFRTTPPASGGNGGERGRGGRGKGKERELEKGREGTPTVGWHSHVPNPEKYPEWNLTQNVGHERAMTVTRLCICNTYC